MTTFLLPFQCETCGSGYAEYVNGCPHCWEAGLRSKVIEVPLAKQINAMRKDNEASTQRACLETDIIQSSAELLRGIVDGKGFDGIYFRLVTMAVEDFRDGKLESAEKNMLFAKRERPNDSSKK